MWCWDKRQDLSRGGRFHQRHRSRVHRGRRGVRDPQDHRWDSVRADRHLHRLARSAAGLGLPSGCSTSSAPRPTSWPTDIRSAYCITYTSGPGVGITPRGRGATVAVVSMPGTPWPATTQIATSRWPRVTAFAARGIEETSYARTLCAWQRRRPPVPVKPCWPGGAL